MKKKRYTHPVSHYVEFRAECSLLTGSYDDGYLRLDVSNTEVGGLDGDVRQQSWKGVMDREMW